MTALHDDRCCRLLLTRSHMSCVIHHIYYIYYVICADPNIRLLVGPERAGIGYGIAGSLCGVIAVAAPMAGGVFMDMDDPNKPLESGVNVAWFFAGTMVLSTLVWLVVSTLPYTHYCTHYCT